MNILVCISQVPDTTTKIQFAADNKSLNASGVTFIINPYDEFGLSRALDMREKEGKQVSITALCVGKADTEQVIRKALAIGADKAVRVDAEPTDAYFVAQQIAAHCKENQYDIIFMGKESIDYNGCMVPGMVAEMLSMQFVSFATKLTLTGDKSADVNREIDGGEEVLNVSFPAVISCQKGLAEWRIPNMRGIMAARTKPLTVVAAAGTGYVTTTSYSYPPAKGNCQYFKADSEVEALADALNGKGFF
ncbi:MAG: electron transfer flavoprotein subunit beta/FixA family protein [Bacteroidia bacterium]